ncbi:MAG: trypsin-like peptidase domain-containing protein [Burkholderiales bacterium]|nr:trypsin-like peptidase domain-containing protein [Burkholderiales bacterium]
MTLRTLWLVFAQAATIALAALFVVVTLRPEWLPARPAGPAQVVVQQAPPAAPSADPGGAAVSYNRAVQRAVPGVVNVFTSREVQVPSHPFADDPIFRRFFGDPGEGATRRARSLGSGVVVSPSGYVLTNNHVVEGMDEIEVATPDGRTLKARIVGTDPETDLAVLKVDAEGLPAVAFGDIERVRVGDVVLAIGNPFGVGQTVTMGIVSALGRSGLGLTTYENLIQTDAAINRGNSGGALVDVSGALIGVNTAILSPTGGSLGIGFAVPVSTARSVMEQIVATGSVTRGFLGIEARELTPELAQSLGLPGGAGVEVAGLIRGGPAAQAGVRVSDVLVAIDGRPIPDQRTMLDIAAALRPGSKATLGLRRNGRAIGLQIVVGTRPKPPRG